MHNRSPSVPSEFGSNAEAAERRRGQAPPPAPGPSNKIQVHKRQEKNSMLRHLRNVAFEITPGLVADFVLGPKTCAVFISLRYHLLYPHYLIQRIKELSGHFTLRVLLCHVDVDDSETPLLEINKMAVFNDFTLVLAWSLQEAARYLETYKAYEHKSADSIQEKVDDDFLGKLQDCFGVVRSVNKSDVLTLASNFGSLKAVCDATAGELSLCPGLGEKKVARIHEALHEPLVRTHSSSRLKRNRTEG
ncbi:unnamed protein product [Ectocarpus sp. 4 AP-2014]